MRVLFLIPSHHRHVNPSPDGMPLGVLYLASMIRKDHDAKVVDAFSFPDDENIEESIDDFSPDLIAISIPFKILENPAKLLTERIKKNYDVRIVLGGLHTTLALDKIKSSFQYDYIISGESEYIFRDLVNHLDSGKTPLPEGVIKHDSQSFDKIQSDNVDVDKIPFPARDLLKYRERYFERILTSRGCGFSCAFCSSRRFWRGFRARGVDNIIDELNNIYSERGLVPVSFADDSFTFNRERVIRLCEAIKKRGVKTAGLGFSSHPERLDKELLDTMRAVGFNSIFLGLESGSDEVLKKIGKKYNRSRIEELIKYALELGYDIHTSFMIGLPGESEKDIEMTLNWAQELPVRSIGFHIFYPFEGCPIREEPKKYGVKILETPLNEGDIDGEAIVHNGVLSPRVILDYYYRARALAKNKSGKNKN